MAYSFQDELTRQHAETLREEQRAAGKAGYQRLIDYRAGVGIAAAIAGRVAAGCQSAAESAATLRAVSAQQPDTLTGRVVAGELADEIARHQTEAERQSPQREADPAYRARAAELWQLHYAGAGRERQAWQRNRD